MLPMKISNWESIEYSDGLNCTNEECDNKSCSYHARNIIGWCDTPYGYMMVCECKKCFTKYRFHGTIGGKFDFENFADNFLMRVEMENEELYRMKIENIKFKAKRLDNNTWVEGYFYSECGNAYIIENRQKERKLNRNLTYKVDHSTVCQFTGEKDMNCNEIYIGDIISNLETGSVVEVAWNDRLKRFDCKFLNADTGLNVPFGIFVSRFKRIVVVGNKFDKEK